MTASPPPPPPACNMMRALQYCATYCNDYPYYGLQYGSECWCGDYDAQYDKYGEANNCDFDCSGNSQIHCGGRYAMQVFSQGQF